MIRLIYEPSVYLVVRPQLVAVNDSKPNLSDFLIDEGVEKWTSDAYGVGDWIPEVAGRLCYMSFKNPRPGGNKTYLDHIKECGHGSTLEHCNWSFIFTGVSRSLTHELVRHRAGWGFSQLSQRYVDESDASFVVPPELAEEVREAERLMRANEETASVLLDHSYLDENPHAYTTEQATGLRWVRSVEDSLTAYQRLVEYLMKRMAPKDSGGAVHATTEIRKAARGAARSLLPNATETKIFVTMNARAARHFIEMRGSRNTDVEIRRLAYMVWKMLHAEAPNLFGDYDWWNKVGEEKFTGGGGFPNDVSTPTRKV